MSPAPAPLRSPRGVLTHGCTGVRLEGTRTPVRPLGVSSHRRWGCVHVNGLADPVGTPPLSPFEALPRVPSVLSLTAAKLRPKLPGEKRERWLASARPEQLPPTGTWWDVWFILAGRG